MDIGVLGSLTVDGAPVDFPRRVRVVLAALALRVGDDVTAERLADAMWVDQPPASWAKVVQGCVVRLRKALGATTIRTVPQGYRLEVPPDQVDAVRFERLLLRGRELLTLAEPDRAAYVLGEALALWRGPALADLEGWEPGRVAAGRLEELRFDAEELNLEAAIRAGRHREVLGAARACLEQAPLRERRWALLALAQYQSGRQAEALRTLGEVRTVLSRELGLDPGPDLVTLEEAIRRQDPGLVATAAIGEVRPTCPYRGLVPYDVADAEDFYGRDGDVVACRERLGDIGAVTVVGPSGSGKSSLVRAGVTAGLLRDGYRVTVITPGLHPLEALSAAPTTGPRRTLVVDQFEEIVGLCADPAERAAFLSALSEYAERAWVVLAVRADRLGDLTGQSGFTRLVERSLYLLDPMRREDLVAAIEGPAAGAGLRLEPGLVDLLVREVEGEPGALPLLSHALRSTWELRESNTLTVAGYRATGGVRGAVAQTAEAVYEHVPLDQRTALRDLLLRLVTPSPDGAAIRSRIPRRLVSGRHHEELIETLVAARLVTSDEDVIELAHEALVRAWPRLQDWLDDDAEGQRILRHLVAAADSWEAMQRPDSELYRGTRLAKALEWQSHAHSELTPSERDFLDGGRRLGEAEARSAAQRAAQQRRSNRRLRGLLAGVAALSMALLLATSLAVSQARTADERRDAALRERNEATALSLALAAREVGESNGALAMALAVESLHATPEPLLAATSALAEARLAFDTSPAQPIGEALAAPDASDAVAFSPDGKLLAAAGEYGVTVWDTSTNERLPARTPRIAGGVSGLEFSPDGRLLATAGFDGAVRLWNVSNGNPQGALLGPVRGARWLPNSVAFSPDGSTIAAGGFEGRLRLWRIRTSDPIPAPNEPNRGIYSVAFGPGGSMVATAGDGGIRVWDLRSGKAVGVWPSVHDVDDVSFSPDGKLLASADWYGVRLWNVTTGQQVGKGIPLAAGASAVSFNSSGSLLAIAAADDGLRVWDPASGSRAAQLITSNRMTSVGWSAHGDILASGGFSGVRLWHPSAHDPMSQPLRGGPIDSVAAVAFSRHDDLLASSSLSEGDDDGVRLWDVRSRKQVARPVKDPFGVGLIAFNPERDSLAMVTTDPVDLVEVVRLWDLGTGRAVLTITPREDVVYDLAFSPDGGLLATAGTGVQLWDATDGRPVGPPIRHRPGVTSIAFSPDGERLATAGDDGTVRLWDYTTGEQIGPPFEHGVDLRTVAFSPDGSRMATAGHQGIRVWDTDSGKLTTRGPGEEGDVWALAFRPPGDILAAAGEGRALRLWDVATGELIGPPLTGHTGEINDLAFSHGGDILATASTDGTVRVWDWRPEQACKLAARYVTPEQVQEQVPRDWDLACDYGS